MDSSDQFIFCEVEILDDGITIFVCFVYADNRCIQRRKLWADLQVMSTSVKNAPWLVLGDFNATRYQHEKVGGDLGWPSTKEEFNNALNVAELEDLKYGGCQFTWSNKQSDGMAITTKIDRVLVNEKWIVSFPLSSANFCTRGTSDHSPMVISVSETKNKGKPFRYFDFWADNERFIPIVKQTWGKYVKGSLMFRICSKLKELKHPLKELNKKRIQ